MGDLDVLLIDLPPGTGDVPLTLAQKVKITGAITVTTPQDIALIDVIKALDMFQTVGVPNLGVIENMSYFRQDGGPSTTLFPKGRLRQHLKQNNIPLLAEIPFHIDVAKGGEMGLPVTELQPQESKHKFFNRLHNSFCTLHCTS